MLAIISRIPEVIKGGNIIVVFTQNLDIYPKYRYQRLESYHNIHETNISVNN